MLNDNDKNNADNDNNENEDDNDNNDTMLSVEGLDVSKEEGGRADRRASYFWKIVWDEMNVELSVHTFRLYVCISTLRIINLSYLSSEYLDYQT